MSTTTDGTPIEGSEDAISYKATILKLPAFDLTGFTRIVLSGGEMYEQTRANGNWDILRGVAGSDGTIYGVASHDHLGPKDHYRYSLTIKAPADHFPGSCRNEGLFSLHIMESDWIVFTIERFNKQYGAFWQANPYEMVKKLGWEFNGALGLHIDAFAPSYASDSDSMEFMMPVTRPEQNA
jgi:hypothetical protein